MTSYLNTSFTRKHSTVLPEDVSAASILSIIHDHEKFIRLNPLVTHFKLLSTQNTPFPLPPSDEGHPPLENPTPNEIWKTYEVVDTIPRLGGLWTQNVRHTNALCSLQDGMKGVTNPGAGVHIMGDWVVEKEEEGSWVLRETIKVQCSVVLVPLIWWTLNGSHDVVHGRLLEVARGGAAGN